MRSIRPQKYPGWAKKPTMDILKPYYGNAFLVIHVFEVNFYVIALAFGLESNIRKTTD